MKMDHITFTETIERLAERIGYQLHYDETGSSDRPSVNRSRLVAANTAAMKFYQEELRNIFTSIMENWYNNQNI